MLTKIQIRASGTSAHEVEGELRWAAARIISDFGLTGELTEQVIEGKPDDSFAGRLTIGVSGMALAQGAYDAEDLKGLMRR